MITTNDPTKEQLESWYGIYMENLSSLSPDRKSGKDLIKYLQKHYELNSKSDIFDAEEIKIKGLADISSSRYLSSRIPEGKTPVIKIFFLQNKGRNKSSSMHRLKTMRGSGERRSKRYQLPSTRLRDTSVLTEAHIFSMTLTQSVD